MSREVNKSFSSPAFRDDESYLAMAHGRKTTSFDDLTFRSSPGSPVAASTVVRPVTTNPNENQRIVNNAELRGSLYGVEDAREQAQLQKSSKHAHFKLSPILSPGSSIEDPRTARREPETSRKEPGRFALELDNTSDVQDFIRTHNVSEMLEKIDLSSDPLSNSGTCHEESHPPRRDAMINKVSFSGGMLSSQDWTSINGDTMRPPEARDSLVSLGTEISEASSLGILQMDDIDMSSSLIHVDSGLLKDLKNHNQVADNDRELDATLRDVSDIEDNFLEEGETDEDDSIRVRKAMQNLVKNGEKDYKRNAQKHESDAQRHDTGAQRQETGGHTKNEIPHQNARDSGNGFRPVFQKNEKRLKSTAGSHLKKESRKCRDLLANKQEDGKEMVSGLSSLSHGKSQQCVIDEEQCATNGEGNNFRKRDLRLAGKVSSGRRKEIEDGLDGYDASDEEVANGEEWKRRNNPLRHHVTGGYRQQRSTDSGPSSLQSSMDRLDSMFFNHSDQTATQRPGSGDGGEVFQPTPTRRSPVPPSPSRLSWMGSQEGAFPSGEECSNGNRVDSRSSFVSIKFDEEESTGAKENQYFRPEARGKATGIDSVESSEIDTEDELAAVRKENGKQALPYLLRPAERLCVGDSGESSEGRLSRPGLEGGSSDENEDISFPSHQDGLSMRQSAEGEVVSPVPGDGGGGGDGMSDGETGSTVPSVVTSSHSVFDIQRGLGMALSVQGVSVNEGRNVEGQSRSQPVGDGIVNDAPPTRQVRFASVDRTYQRTLSGSDFSSDFSRDIDQSPLNEFNSHTMEVSPGINQFLLPSNISQGAANSTINGSNWMHNASSFHISQMSNFQDVADGNDPGDFVRAQRAVGGSTESLERTLTPNSAMQSGNMQSPPPDFARASSLGEFGAEAENQFPNDHDFTFSQKLSFGGEGEFSELYRGSFSSEHSSDRLSSDREGPGGFYANSRQRESTEGASQQQQQSPRTDTSSSSHQESQTRMSYGRLGFSEPEQHTGPVYFDEDGQGVTDLAFRTSLPFLHQQGIKNPFDASGDQHGFSDQHQHFGEEDFMGGVDFGIGSDEEFVSADIGASVLDKDEKAFEEEHVFSQDCNMSPPVDHEFSNWSIANTNHVDITGEESFCRISVGAFMSRRTEALGSLSGDASMRPNFGDGEIISPPSMTPVGIFDEHSSPPDDSPPSCNAPATSERYSGVGDYHPNSQSYNGQHSTGFSGHPKSNPRPTISGQEDNYISKGGSKTQSEDLKRRQHPFEERMRDYDTASTESDATLNITEEQEAPPCGNQQTLTHQRITDLLTDAEANRSGTKTPPLQISAIASAIADASSTTNAEELAAMIMAFSNKQSEKVKGKGAKSNKQSEKIKGKGAKSEKDEKAEPQKGDDDGIYQAGKESEDPNNAGHLATKTNGCPKNAMFLEKQRLSDLYVKPSENSRNKHERDRRSDAKRGQNEMSKQYIAQKGQDIAEQGCYNEHDLSLIPSKQKSEQSEQSKAYNTRHTLDTDDKMKKSRQRLSKQEGRNVNEMERAELNPPYSKNSDQDRIPSYQKRPSVDKVCLNEIQSNHEIKPTASRNSRGQKTGDNMDVEGRQRPLIRQKTGDSMDVDGRQRPSIRQKTGDSMDVEGRQRPLIRQRPSIDRTSHDNDKKHEDHQITNPKTMSHISNIENASKNNRGKKVRTSPQRYDQRQCPPRDRDTGSNLNSHSQLRNDSEPDGEATSIPSLRRQRTSRSNHTQRSNYGQQAISANSQKEQANQGIYDDDDDTDLGSNKNEIKRRGDRETLRQNKQDRNDMRVRPPGNGAREHSQLPQRQPTTGQTRLAGDKSVHRGSASARNSCDRELLHPEARHSPHRSQPSQTCQDRKDDYKPGNDSGESTTQQDIKVSRRTLPSLPRDSLSSAKTCESARDEANESMNTKYARQVEAIKQAINEGKDMMSYIGSSPESDDSVTSPTPSPEGTPTMNQQFSFDMKDVEKPRDEDERETIPIGNDMDDQVSPVVTTSDSGRRTSTPNATDVQPQQVIGDLNQRADAQSPSLQRHLARQPVSSFQAFPNGPHFTVNPPTTTPTLLTSQSLMTTSQVSQYLNDRPIIHSRPMSSSHGLAATSHLPAPPSLHATTHDPQLYNSLSASGIATSTAPYYSHLQQQPTVGAPFGHPASSTGAIHLQSTYPFSNQFVQSLPTFQGLAGAPSAVPGLSSTIPPHLQTVPTNTGTGVISSALVVPDQLRFKDVCCLGIASQSVLPLHNHGNRWLQCTLEIVSVMANGEEITNSPPVFIVKPRTIVSPHTTDEMKILFAPHQPGIYTAEVQVGASPVVADREVIQHIIPQMVMLTALAERPNVEFNIDSIESKVLDFGEMGIGLTRSKRISLVNRGQSTVPIRLLLSSTSSAWHYFSLTVEAEQCNLNAPQGGASASRPLHITLQGKRNNTPSSTAVWVHFRAPPDQIHGASSRTLAPPDCYFAKLEGELDVPGRQAMALAELDLKAVVGVARLHAPTSMQALSFSSTVGRTRSRNLPLKNAGNIKLVIGINVTQASELFVLVPEELHLQPGQETDVLVKYTPKEAPSVVESLLTMQIKPDGPKYEVVLRGEATLGERSLEKQEETVEDKEPEKPVLLCNKQYIAWGGVPVGRALQQKIVLRNSDKNALKLRVSVKGAEEFQLQSRFNSPSGKPEESNKSNQIIVSPSSDYPLHLLFAPTQVTTYQSTLTIKQSGSNTKYSVPLSGYGGTSKLLIEDVNSIGDTYTVNVGPVNAGSKFVDSLTARNSGPRAAFVKIISFVDLRAKVKLPASRLNVEPNEFVLNCKASRTVTVTYHLSDRESALCMDRSSVVAVIGFFYGDEISRQQYKKSLQPSINLSSDNPLRGVLFKEKFMGEEHVHEECDLPLRSNDQQLFYSCMSRMMVTLVGTPANSDGTDPMANLTLTAVDSPMTGTNSGQMVPFTPPVRDIPDTPTPMSVHPMDASPAATDLTLTESGSRCKTWIVVPERLMLEAPKASADGSTRSDSKPSVVVINYTNRVISFELSWPAHVLSVTPQNGMIQPKSQVVILVSPRHSIYARGVELPWRGHLLIRCDGKQKEVAVQIRQDLALDTSLYRSTEQPQALQGDVVTPYVTKERIQTAAVKVKSKHIKFPRTRVETTSEATLEFQNTTSEEVKWCLSSFASAYVKGDEGPVLRTTYSVFRFARQSGSLGPQQKIRVILTFIPRDDGTYSQFWDLESHTMSHSGVVNSVVHSTRIEVLGEGYKESRHSRPKKVKSPVRRQRNSSSNSRQRQRSGSRDRSSSASLEEISLIPKKKDAPEFQMNPISLKKDVLEFERIEPGTSLTLKLTISNSSVHNILVHFQAPKPPFYIKHSKHNLKPRHFTSLPISFKPIRVGRYEGALVIESNGHRRVANFIGECHILTQQQSV